MKKKTLQTAKVYFCKIKDFETASKISEYMKDKISDHVKDDTDMLIGGDKGQSTRVGVKATGKKIRGTYEIDNDILDIIDIINNTIDDMNKSIGNIIKRIEKLEKKRS